MTHELDPERLPRCDSAGHTMEADYFLTHAIWRNSYGSCQPETGVRRVVDGKVAKEGFRLIEHGCSDFAFAEPIILRLLRKQWDAVRIGRLVEWLSSRRRAKFNLSSRAPEAKP
jgi:hypothetical protein